MSFLLWLCVVKDDKNSFCLTFCVYLLSPAWPFPDPTWSEWHSSECPGAVTGAGCFVWKPPQTTDKHHTHTHTRNEELGQIRQMYRMISTAIHLLSVHLLKVLRLRSSSPCTVAIGWVRPGYMKTKRSSTLWMEKIQINQKWDSYLELKRWSVCKQEGGKANTLQLFS